uniref:Uncharacterized protein n=1 Tax=Pygocentrus nattereri TaxID=42514 RepID=A0AAR2IYE3_PYGNA
MMYITLLLCLVSLAGAWETTERQCAGNRACMMSVVAANAVDPDRHCLVCHKFAVPWVPTPLDNATAAPLIQNMSDCGLNTGVGFMLNVSQEYLLTGRMPVWATNGTQAIAHRPNDCETNGPRYSPQFQNISFSVIPTYNATMCLCSVGVPDGPILGHTQCRVNFTALNLENTNCSVSTGNITHYFQSTNCTLLMYTQTSGPVSWVCGQSAYTRFPIASQYNWRGCCTPAIVVPNLAVLHKPVSTRRGASTYNGYTLADPWTSPGTAVGWSVFLGGGTTAALNKINGLAWQILVLANETEKALTLVNTEMAAIRHAVLQNRMALDLLLAKEGGVCKVLNTSCCFSLPDYYRNMSDLIAHMRAGIQPPPLADDSWFSWLTSLMGPWGHWIVTMLIPFICVLLLVICIAPCISNCISAMVARSFTAQYHMLQMDFVDDENHPSSDSLNLRQLFNEGK